MDVPVTQAVLTWENYPKIIFLKVRDEFVSAMLKKCGLLADS
jgi:hypothetical protein